MAEAVMAEALLAEIINTCPPDNCLDAPRESAALWCKYARVPCTPDTILMIPRSMVKNLVETVLATLVDELYYSGLADTNIVAEYLLDDMAEVIAQAQGTPVEAFPDHRFRPTLLAVVAYTIDSDDLWRQVFSVVAGAGSPLEPTLDRLPQRRRNEGGFATVHTADMPKGEAHGFLGELPLLYVPPLIFLRTYFRGLPHLHAAAEAFFRKCQEDPNAPPLYVDGRWVGWDGVAHSHEDTLHWIVGLSRELATFVAEGYRPAGAYKPIPIRTEWQVEPAFDIVQKLEIHHKIEVSGISDPTAHQRNCSASALPLVLPPHDPMTAPSARRGPAAWFEPSARHARRLLANDHRRRFVMGFAMSGSLMRVWSFDRAGGVATEVMDIHKHGLWFVSTLLGFLCSDEKQFGFDTTITRTGPDMIHFHLQRENNRTELLSTDEQVSHSTFISGRGTKVYRALHPYDKDLPLTIKDSWQVAGSQQEGELLRKATECRVVNVARYYHHETVKSGGLDDDIDNNVRKGLHDALAHVYDTAPGLSATSPSSPVPAPAPAPAPQKKMNVSSREEAWTARSITAAAGLSYTTAGSKRSAMQALIDPTPPKRFRYTPRARPNRVHRRVVMRDFGEPLTWAESPAVLLRKLEQCIEGHESLYKKGRILHRNISVDNLLINSDPDNSSWPAFLCDLDVAVDLDNKRAQEAWESDSVGTRPFMAIGVHLGEQHTFMHDLESFFWVLFWVCTHLEMRGSMRDSYKFDGWNRDCDRATVIADKKRIITDRGFKAVSEQYFTWYASPMKDCLDELRRALFPNGRQWKTPDLDMYARMKQILRRYSEDPQVLKAEVW